MAYVIAQEGLAAKNGTAYKLVLIAFIGLVLLTLFQPGGWGNLVNAAKKPLAAGVLIGGAAIWIGSAWDLGPLLARALAGLATEVAASLGS